MPRERFIGVKTKCFTSQQAALNFQDWMDQKNPWCEIRAGYDPKQKLWCVQWLCNHGWYEKASGRRVYY